ncbi:MAG: NAD(P)/FAD-dependent oxidoreductase [Elusimicrobia bacterium]|nr:NAD(P)/FAD-dependent oxidoreductase [Elusimicrobiota bacterium]
MKDQQNNKFDVIIIGAGPAGLGSAINLSKKGISVLLIEKEKIGATQKTWLTFDYILQKYKLKECIKNTFSEVTLSCYLGNTFSLKNKSFIYPIDEEKALKLLAQQAIKNGAVIREKEVFINYSFIKNDYLEIKTTKNTYYSKFAVDAMGRDSQILKSKGLFNNTIDMGCLTYFLEKCNYKNEDKMLLYDSFFPGSDYFWLVPHGNKRIMAGIFCFSQINDENIGEKHNKLKSYLAEKNITGKIYAVKKGNIPLGDQNHVNVNNFLCIGDSCNTPLPSSGFSFNRCLDESEILADFIMEYFNKKASIKDYRKRILGSKIPAIGIHLMISDMLSKFTNPMLNKAIGEMNNLSEDFIMSFLTGKDMSVTFSATVLQSILKIFSLSEIRSLSLQHNYMNTLTTIYHLLPGLPASGIRKQLTDFIKKIIKNI